VTLLTINLTAGDWDIFGEVWHFGGVNTTSVNAGINTVAATMPVSGPNMGTALSQIQFPSVLTGGDNILLGLCPCRQLLAATTPIYLVASQTGSTSGAQAQGKIWARRAR
jgi:hypothetical protein